MGGASFNSSQRHAVDAAPPDVFGGEYPSAKEQKKKNINKNANDQAPRENDTQGSFT
jgi:hypothetical protein